MHNNEECIFRSPWASIWVISLNRSLWASNMGGSFSGIPGTSPLKVRGPCDKHGTVGTEVIPDTHPRSKSGEEFLVQFMATEQYKMP